MARARNIKPGFFTHDELGELSPLARLAFIGLWGQADFNGNMKCKPKRLKVEVLPYDNCDFGELISELEAAGFLFRYEVKGGQYLQIVNFRKHQRPHKNEMLRGTDIPEPVTNTDPNGTDPEQNRNETEQERDENRSNPPDTGYRIPDTLNRIPIITMARLAPILRALPPLPRNSLTKILRSSGSSAGNTGLAKWGTKLKPAKNSISSAPRKTTFAKSSS